VKGVLAPEGVFSVRVSGGANYLGAELVFLGASALATLESVFDRVLLKPGEDSWFYASDGGLLTASGEVLRGRLAAVPGAASVYPPDGLLSQFPPDRIAFQMDKYRRTVEESGAALLVNTDKRPKALLFHLLLAFRRAGVRSLADSLPEFLRVGLAVFLSGILIFGVLRFVYNQRSVGPGLPRERRARPRLFDLQALIAAVGFSGMALGIVLMFFYQSRFGSLFLYVGLASSLFMLGSFAGGLFCERLQLRPLGRPRVLLIVFTAFHLVLFFWVFNLPEKASQAHFALLFTVAGVFSGVYFPLAAAGMRDFGRTVEASGARLEMLDHFGGAAGAVLTGIVLLPVLGGGATLVLLAALVLVVNLGGFLAPEKSQVGKKEHDRFDVFARPAGYVLFGVAAFSLVASNLVAGAQSGREERDLLAAAREMTGNAQLVEKEAAGAEGEFQFFEAADAPGVLRGYVFSTSRLAGGISGYGGPMTLAVFVDGEGVLENFKIVRSDETPAYLSFLGKWMEGLSGARLFDPDPFSEVDAVSGATMTSGAVLNGLEVSGRIFAERVLGMEVAAGGEPVLESRFASRDFLVLAALFAAAVALRFWPGVWRRRVLLATSLLVAGFVLNLQYSTQQAASLLSFRLPGGGLSGAFFLVLVLPVLVAFFGNVYCGNICPFGALQEFLGDLRPRRFATDPRKEIWRFGRAVKYVLLFLLVVLFAGTRDSSVLRADVLITVFGAARDAFVLVIAGVLLILSVVFRRFWCRNLCPAGAFLSLLGGLRLLRRFLPETRPAQCDMGVRDVSELDCLLCDRCRHEKK